MLTCVCVCVCVSVCVCVCVCLPHFNVWSSKPIYTEFDMNIMSFEAIATSYFRLSTAINNNLVDA